MEQQLGKLPVAGRADAFGANFPFLLSVLRPDECAGRVGQIDAAS